MSPVLCIPVAVYHCYYEGPQSAPFGADAANFFLCRTRAKPPGEPSPGGLVAPGPAHSPQPCLRRRHAGSQGYFLLGAPRKTKKAHALACPACRSNWAWFPQDWYSPENTARPVHQCLEIQSQHRGAPLPDPQPPARTPSVVRQWILAPK